MKKRIVLLRCCACLLLTGCAALPALSPTPAPTAEDTPAPTPTVSPTEEPLDLSSLRETDYVLRQTGEDAARLRTWEERSCDTVSEDLSLTEPILIAEAETRSGDRGAVVTIRNDAEEKRQVLALCRSLTLQGETWPALRVESGFDRPMTLEGGRWEDLSLDGGEITLRRIYVDGLLKVRGRAVVRLEDCVFSEAAVVATDETGTVLVGEADLFAPAGGGPGGNGGGRASGGEGSGRRR